MTQPEALQHREVDASSLAFAWLEPKLRHALRRWRLPVAAHLAELMQECAVDDDVATQLHYLGRGCLNYHAYLQSLPRGMSPPNLLFGVDAQLESNLEHAQDSLQDAFDDALSSTGGTALVQLLFAYYGLVQLDGLRAIWWLERCFQTLRMIEPLPPYLEATSAVVAENLEVSLNRERKPPPVVSEPYGWFEQASRHVGKVLKLDRSGMEALDRFLLRW